MSFSFALLFSSALVSGYTAYKLWRQHHKAAGTAVLLALGHAGIAYGLWGRHGFYWMGPFFILFGNIALSCHLLNPDDLPWYPQYMRRRWDRSRRVDSEN